MPENAPATRKRTMHGCGFFAALLVSLPTVAVAQDGAPRIDPYADAVDAAGDKMMAGQLAEALTALDAPLAAYDALHAGDTQSIYCATNPNERSMYAGMAASEGRPAIAIDPHWCEALYLKGHGLAGQRQFPQAIAFLERAVSMAPRHAHYLNELGFVYQQAGNHRASLDSYRRAREAAYFADNKPAERLRALNGVGYNLIELGDWDRAEASFQEALSIDPANAIARNELAFIAAKRPKAK